LEYYVGCSGWSNTGEKFFYPDTLDTKDHLSYYSKVFDFVEVDLFRSTYTLNKFTFKKWAESTPSNFRFAIKISKHLVDHTCSLEDFLEELTPLKEKILAIVIHQTALTLKDGREWLDEILRICTYHGYSVALEFDHYSWYQDLTYHILKKHDAALVWSDSHRYPIVTTDFLYLRITENEKKWIEKINEKELETEHKKKTINPDAGIDFAIIVVDKPSKATSIIQLLGMPERNYDQPRWTGRAIFHVDLNSFYPSCEELRDPSLVGKAHAVIMTDQDNNGKITKGAVSSCSYEARKLGVRSAMSLSKALELCPDLILKAVDIPYYRQVSNKVMSILEGYADVLEQASIDEAYLDCTRKADNVPIIEEYAIKIKNAIKEECSLSCSIGVGSTKSIAKIASDFQKPDGLTIIYPNDASKFLEPLEVGRISGIGNKTQKILKEEMGIKTIGQLAKYDVQKLIERFGRKSGLWMWQVANRQDNNDPVMTREDNISLSNEHTLDNSTKDREKMLKYLNSLVDDLYKRIRTRGYEFRTVGVKIVRTDFSVETRDVSFPYFQNKRESIVSVIDELLQRFSFDDDKTKNKNTSLPVRKVGLKVSNLVRIDKKKPPEQKTLLDYI
jgi:DNA polymerase IV (archaeal DinB-like DNA polymerase)